MAKLCLCLTAPTIAKNLAILDQYRSMVDMAELRGDYLEPQERFKIRSFPEKANIPTILTVRRRQDGGLFTQGEGVRLVIIAKGLAFADPDKRKNFAYVDIENDLQITSIQEAARIFGTKVIRSMHCIDGPPPDLAAAWRSVSASPYEIPKLAIKARGMADAEQVVRFFDGLPKDRERIVIAMGEYGACTRILSERIGSAVCYTTPAEQGLECAAPGQLEPESLRQCYRLGAIPADSDLYGILGGPSVLGSLSPRIHNAGFAAAGINARYLPFPSDELEPFMRLAELLKIKGFSITVPFKEKILPRLSWRSPEVDAIGACNTAVRRPEGWAGYNTDALGFRSALLEFLGTTKLTGLKACIIGAGGAARSVAYVLSELGARACVINRSITKAKHLAETYDLAWAGMSEQAVALIEQHNDLIVQTTSVGMEGGSPGDPLDWYEFSGKEAVFETIYNPAQTPFMARAKAAGCRATNGRAMLMAQAAAQFSLFTSRDYPEGAFEV